MGCECFTCWASMRQPVRARSMICARKSMQIPSSALPVFEILNSIHHLGHRRDTTKAERTKVGPLILSPLIRGCPPNKAIVFFPLFNGGGGVCPLKIRVCWWYKWPFLREQRNKTSSWLQALRLHLEEAKHEHVFSAHFTWSFPTFLIYVAISKRHRGNFKARKPLFPAAKKP